MKYLIFHGRPQYNCFNCWVLTDVEGGLEHIWLKLMLFTYTDQHGLLFIDILRCDLYYNGHSTFTSFSTSSTINVAIYK